METESDPKVKAIWELHLNMELEHLRLAVELFKRHDGREPEQVLASQLPAPVTFEPNKGYLRELLGTEIDVTTIGTGYVQDMHERFQQWQEAIHGGEKAPSELIIEENRTKSGEEYRLETEGPHPVPSLRANRAGVNRAGR
jgi:predicted metal-dependent hydrolase